MTQNPHNSPHIDLLRIIDLNYEEIEYQLKRYDVTDSGCWEYNGRGDRSRGKFHNYGRIQIRVAGKKRDFRAHRLSYAFFNGVDPKELYVCHKCDNPKCINPSHLFLGTAKDNSQDMLKKGRNYVASGEKNARSKIKEGDVRRVIELIKEGRNNKQIAELLPIGHAMVSRIRLGKSWGEFTRKLGYEPGEKYQSIKYQS